MANQGIPEPDYTNQLNSINQNKANAVRALGRSANAGAGLAGIVRQGNEATSNLNAQDAIARNRNMLQLLQERQQLAQQRDKAWDWNYQQRYLGNLAKSQALKTAGNTNINSGFNDLSETALTGMKLGLGQRNKQNVLTSGQHIGQNIGYGLGQGIGYNYGNDQNQIQGIGQNIGQGIEAQ